MAGNNGWKDAVNSARSLGELRDILEAYNPEFKNAADERRHAEAMADHLRAALRQSRKRAHIGQTTLAGFMGTTQSSISALETGSGDLGVITMFRYLEGLSINPAKWLEEYAHELREVADNDNHVMLNKPND